MEIINSAVHKGRPKDFSGTAFSLCYKPHNGFADFAVVTLTIEKGVVTKVDYSDPYAAFEAKAKLDHVNEQLLEHLRRNYPEGYQHAG